MTKNPSQYCQLPESVLEEVREAFRARPEYGSLGFVFHIHAGSVVRTSVNREVVRKEGSHHE